MRFGIIPPYGRAPLESGAWIREFAGLVEELGFESLWAVEHAVMCLDVASRYPYDPSGVSPFSHDTAQPDPLVWLSHVAAATTRLRLGTAVLILPQHNPVLLAKAAASLDRLSDGRLLLGVGVGWVREEAGAVGSDFSNRGRRASEYIRAMRALWREEVASFAGEFVRFERVVCAPRPVRPEGVPILVGGHSRAAARRAGRLGDGFYPLGVEGEDLAALRALAAEEAQAHGRDADALELTRSGPADPATARRYAAEGADRMVVFAPHGDLAKLRGALARFRDEAIVPLAGDAAA